MGVVSLPLKIIHILVSQSIELLQLFENEPWGTTIVVYPKLSFSFQLQILLRFAVRTTFTLSLDLFYHNQVLSHPYGLRLLSYLLLFPFVPLLLLWSVVLVLKFLFQLVGVDSALDIIHLWQRAQIWCIKCRNVVLGSTFFAIVEFFRKRFKRLWLSVVLTSGTAYAVLFLLLFDQVRIWATLKVA